MDGYALRAFFEVDAEYIAITAIKALVDESKIERKIMTQAIKKYGININKPNPTTI